MHVRNRAELTGCGGADKTTVVGARGRDTNQVRARVVEATDRPTLHGFVCEHAAAGATVYTDEASVHQGLPDLLFHHHEGIKHSVGEYVRDRAHTNGQESFQGMLTRGDIGVCHKMSPKHPGHCINEFAGRHNLREQGTLAQMADVVESMVGSSSSIARSLPTTDCPVGRGPDNIRQGTQRTPSEQLPLIQHEVEHALILRCAPALGEVVGLLCSRNCSAKLGECHVCS